MRTSILVVTALIVPGFALADDWTDALAVKGLLMSSIGDWSTSAERLQQYSAYIISKDLNNGVTDKPRVLALLSCLRDTDWPTPEKTTFSVAAVTCHVKMTGQLPRRQRK